MKSTRTHGARGFTLIETIVALAVMAVAALGALAAVNFSVTELSKGQLRLYTAAIADAALQRMMAVAKTGLPTDAFPTPEPKRIGIGARPWSPDTSTAVGDLSAGAYFRVVTGQNAATISPATDVPANTTCDAVPKGVICREILVTRGMPFGDCTGNACGGIIPAGANPITFWVRVSRKGDNPNDDLMAAVVHREVFFP
jgi:prepilin-type N-terminal cleavage/methylation domain-containing protein